MNRSGRFVLTLILATAIAALGSHWVASWLKVKTQAAEPFIIGKPTGNPPAFLAASSVGGYGISWGQIATQLDSQILTWGIAGGTPIEFEQFQKKVPEAQNTIIVISTYDLDEARACDYRAAIVPLGETIDTLRSEHADWKYSRRVLSQYPMTWLRTLFPTLGRSRGLMGAMLIKVEDIIKKSAGKSDTAAGPTINFSRGVAEDEYTQQKLSDWSASKVAGKLVAERVDFQSEHSFDGPKKVALERMLQFANQRGRAILVVMPISAAYTREFISPELVRGFEAAMAEIGHSSRQTQIVRLDQVSGLGSDGNFCDLVHMNVGGQKLATDALQAQLKQIASRP